MASSPSSSDPTRVQDGEEFITMNDRQIGKGAYSDVFFGRTKSGRQVAVKHATKRNEIEAMVLEIKILKQLKDVPNIVQYIGSDHRRITSSSGGLPMNSFSFAMEYAVGNLNSLMEKAENRNGIPTDVLIDLTIDCAAALVSMKNLNIAHRDIKQTNILIFPGSPTKGRRSTYFFKLCDLGCSKSQDTAQEMNTLVGTPNMLHPNLAVLLTKHHNWRTEVGYTAEQCDLWSLGCTLYSCATGGYPIPNSISNKNLYLSAANAVQQNPDAIGMTYKGEQRNAGFGRAHYEFEAIEELPSNFLKRPKWFIYVFTAILRGFFHDPSVKVFSEIVNAMKQSKRYSFLSINQLNITEHCDMSTAPHIGHSFPDLQTCLGYPSNTNLQLISLTSRISIPPGKKLPELIDEDYLVYPVLQKNNEAKLRQIPSKKIGNTEKIVEARLLPLHRRNRIFTAFSLLNEANEIHTLFLKISKILTAQYTLLIDELNRDERVQITSRFAIYLETASIPTMLLDNSNDESREISQKCCESAKERRKELDLHTKIMLGLEEKAKKMRENARSLELDDLELPGIREDLESFQMTEHKEILDTTEYCQSLIENCLGKRTHLLKQLFEVGEGETMKVQIAMDAASSLMAIRNEFTKIDKIISECVYLLEMPFQEMKRIVNDQLQAAGFDRNSMSRSMMLQTTQFREFQRKFKSSHRNMHELAKQLEQELVGFMICGDTLVKNDEKEETTDQEKDGEDSTLKNEEGNAVNEVPMNDIGTSSHVNNSHIIAGPPTAERANIFYALYNIIKGRESLNQDD